MKEIEITIDREQAEKARMMFERPEKSFESQRPNAEICEFSKIIANEMKEKEVRTPKDFGSIMIDITLRIHSKGALSSPDTKVVLARIHGDDLVAYVVFPFLGLCREAFSRGFMEAAASWYGRANSRKS
jgi:hypothetical protein